MATTAASTPAPGPVPETARPLTLLLGGMAAFGAYFAMYAFRKPFAAGTYVDIGGWDFAVDYKTALLIAQVFGYALSKLIGVRVIAEFGRHGRSRLILALIGASWLALILFALVPPPWNIACLFLNGLPLGMIWGLVFSYVEGRRASRSARCHAVRELHPVLGRGQIGGAPAASHRRARDVDARHDGACVRAGAADLALSARASAAARRARRSRTDRPRTDAPRRPRRFPARPTACRWCCLLPAMCC